VKSDDRDQGLVRVVGPLALAASMVSMVIGAGIFVSPAPLSAAMGSLAPLAVLACAVAIGAVVICVAEAGSRVASSGGLYACIERAFGPAAGYVGGLLLLISNVLACAAVSAAFGDTLAALVPEPARALARALVVVAVVSAVCAINIASLARGMQLVAGTTALKLAPLALFVLVGALAVDSRNFHHPALSAPDVGRALLFAFFSFQGFETALCACGEVREPARTIPRALFPAIAIVTLVYTTIQLVAQGLLGDALGHSRVPLADAMGGIHPALRLLMLAGAAVSMFGWLTADILCSPRILFAFARDGVLPALLGRLTATGHTPHWSIVTYGALAVALALSGTYTELAPLATLVLAALYVGACAAAWQLTRRGIAEAGAPLGFRRIGVAAAVGIGSMLALIALGTRKEILGLTLCIAASLIAHLVQTGLASRLGAVRPRDS